MAKVDASDSRQTSGRPFPCAHGSVASTQPSVRGIVVGASTGGPEAITSLLADLPKHVRTPILVVQHMPAPFTHRLAERLSARTSLEVRVARHEEVVQQGAVYLAPGDLHMRLQKGGNRTHITLDRGEPEHSCRPSVDALLRSAAATFGAGTLAVILTGMGADGTRGCEVVRACGGFVIAQDRESSVVWGMPGLVVRSGCANAVLPLSAIAEAISQQVLCGAVSREHRHGVTRKGAQ